MDIDYLELSNEFRLWLLLFRNDLFQQPWLLIIIAWLCTFVISGLFIRPVSLIGKSIEKKKPRFVTIITASLLLSLISGLFNSLIPYILTAWLWIFVLPFIISLLTGIIYYLFNKNSKILQNSIAIFTANFYIEADKSILQGIKQVLRRQIWEQPQTLIGHGIGQVLNSTGFISGVALSNGIAVLSGNIPLANGVALGSYIIVTSRYSGTDTHLDVSERNSYMMVLIRHELGHTMQSRLSGPLYLFKYGIPSAMSQGWTEKDAEFRSDRYLLINFGLPPVFSSYEKDYRPARANAAAYLLMLATMIWGAAWGATAGLFGAYLFVAGIIALFNLGKQQNKML